MRNQKGITLIALVITIIVLLILAGVSIAMLTGQNGILTQANSAKSDTSRAEAIEKINLALNAVKSEVYKQQVTSSSYKPLTGSSGTYALESAITTILGKDTILPSGASGDYVYSLNQTSGILTISYYNTTTKVTTVTGTINLSAAPYTIVAAPAPTV